ncbi:MAG: putative arabinose efflux permease, family [Pseudonocardiales bacterium]|nr:putative arabinose efflux permease, family [Pseudonocardiales bacterium]
MSVQPYRDVLSRPGVRSLIIVCLLARIPITAAPLALTLHVVFDLHRGFAQSGLIAGATAIGAALGSPLLGSLMDRLGLRPILIVTTVAEAAFWLSASHLSYVPLVPAAFLSGVLALPVFTLARQSLAALLPQEQRQAGYALDSMAVELSFAVGPALGVVVITQTNADVTFNGLAALLIGSGLALLRLNPPVHGEDGVDPTPGARLAPAGPRPGLRDWFGPRVFAVMLATFGATFTLVGTDTAFTATMRSFDEIPLLGLVTAIWCIASLVGGFVYGMMPRRVDPLIILALLAAFTVPVALAGNWWVLALLAIPTGVFCAPLISSTAEELTRVTPATVRGQVMGVHASALTVGNAVGAPLVGLIVDRSAPEWGFVGIGLCGLSIALIGLAAQSRRNNQPLPTSTRMASAV